RSIVSNRAMSAAKNFGSALAFRYQAGPSRPASHPRRGNPRTRTAQKRILRLTRLISVDRVDCTGSRKMMRSHATFLGVVLSLVLSPWCGAQTGPIPQTMRAAAFDKGGGPEVLSIHHLPVPVPNAGEVLIAVHGAGVAVWEVGFRQHPNERTRYPAVL